jgi:hypothetical protein
MAKINVWVNDPEKAWTKSKPKGYVRRLIQTDMGNAELIARKMAADVDEFIEGAEVDGLEGREFQEAIIGNTKGGTRKT